MERRKFLIGAAGTAVGTSAVVGSGAFSAATIDGRDVNIAVVTDEDALIGLEDGDTDLVGVGDNGELYISFDIDGKGDGVNPNSTYQVGAIGEKAAGGIESYVQNAGETPVPEVTTDDVLYGDSVDGNDPDTQTDPAFKVMNQTNTDYDVEVFYEGNNVNGATVLMAGAGPTNDGAAAFEIHPKDDDNSGRLGGFPLKSGNTFSISLLVKTEDIDEEDLGDAFDGELILQAGEAEGDY